MLLTQFAPSEQLQSVLADAIDNYDIGDANAEWPNNLISRQAVVYECGVIARRGEAISFAVDSDELELCRHLSSEAREIMTGVEVGMGSEASYQFQPFYICANGQPAATAIDENLIRDRFGGTLFPPAAIRIFPLSEQAKWFAEGVVADAEDALDQMDEEEVEEWQNPLQQWQKLLAWFASREEFRTTAFVEIGEYDSLNSIPPEKVPNGTEMIGSVFPRLLVGLTQKGSLAGLLGLIVQT